MQSHTKCLGNWQMHEPIACRLVFANWPFVSVEVTLKLLLIKIIPIINLEVTVRLQFINKLTLVCSNNKLFALIWSSIWSKCYQDNLWHFSFSIHPLKMTDSPSMIVNTKDIRNIINEGITYALVDGSIAFFMSSKVLSMSPISLIYIDVPSSLGT